MSSSPPQIEIRNLVKKYGEKAAVDDVSLDVYGGEIFGFLGPNGAGKTTTIKAVVGLLQPTSGPARGGRFGAARGARAAAVGHARRVVVRGEPTVGLAPKSARLIKDILRQLADRGAAVFLSTHILEIAEHMCDRIGIINQGRLIAAGTMTELRNLGQGQSRLEDIFLSLTGGAEYAEIAEVLK